ncbi:MAG: type II secretion system minor pseudopilin GspI [Xanthomonadales bacterium]|nr:type II secretion system minor pseudopilin GspI [Xanthomonadales bacterium]
MRERSGQLQRGFTLLEVMVALVVLGLALLAVLQSTGNASRIQARLDETSWARWVASNEIARVRAQAEWPQLGLDRGSTRLGQREWYWRRGISETPEPDLRRIDVQVYSDPAEQQLVTQVSGFIGRRSRG